MPIILRSKSPCRTGQGGKLGCDILFQIIVDENEFSLEITRANVLAENITNSPNKKTCKYDMMPSTQRQIRIIILVV